jgi:hypothetical protein
MNWNNMQVWHWFAIGGGAVLLLGVILYFVPAGKLKVPAILTTAFGGLAAGISLGIIFMGLLGYAPLAPNAAGDDTQQAPDAGGGPPAKGKGGGMMGGGGGMMGGGGGAPKGKGGPGGFSLPPSPPTPRVNLVVLVDFLDKVVDTPVALSLTADDRKAIAKELEGLDAAAEFSNDVASAKLQALQSILEKNRKSMEAVGYRWVTDGKRAPAPKETLAKDSPNPFKEGAPSEHLKSLMERLAKK